MCLMFCCKAKTLKLFLPWNKPYAQNVVIETHEKLTAAVQKLAVQYLPYNPYLGKIHLHI